MNRTFIVALLAVVAVACIGGVAWIFYTSPDPMSGGHENAAWVLGAGAVVAFWCAVGVYSDD